MERFNLSGIYIFDTFEGEEKRRPTCIEDCHTAVRDKWLESLDKEALLRTCQHLCDCLHGVADEFQIYSK